MDIKQLLEKIDQFAGEKVGQKPGDQWRGSDKAPPGKKLVGDSILKDLSKGKTPKSKEQELSEEFQAFLEAEFQDTVDKRPARKNSRPARGHKSQPRYKTIKADEGAMSEKDIELQDYRSMSHKEFQTAYKMTKTEWINKNKALVIQNPSIKKALGLEEDGDSPHPASRDPIVATVVKQMRPGLKNLDMSNEAFLYFAYELGKQRARDAWEDYLPAIRAEYEKGLTEGWESGPEEYEEPYDDADDAYDRMRQDKIDTEAEKEWAKLPKVSTYKLIGRGPNMEPNYEFGDEFDSMEQALDYRAEIMKDPKTPHPEHIGIRTITRVVDKQQTNEAFYNTPKNKEDYDAKMTALQDLQTDPNTANDEELQRKIIIYMDNLQKVANQHGWLAQPAEESRGHKIVATKLKDIERSKKFASGELKIPTPQERQAQLKQLEKAKPVKEYGASNNVTPYGQPAADPKKAAQIAQGAQAFKAATGITAPATNIAKALDDASQGKPADRTSMKVLEPAMQDLVTIMSDPKLGSEYKSLAQKVNQKQQKPQ
jgi:hypothetical protein